MSNGLGLPPDVQLLRWAHEGLSHAEIQAECERVAGRRLARATVSAALSLAFSTTKAGTRSYETVPWRVQPVHASAYPVRLLRLLSRRRAGIPLDEESESRLGSWLAMLERERVIVAYCPVSDDGFLYIDEGLRAGPNPDVPIRVPILTRMTVAEQD